jgi:hypothetical protein
LSVWAFAEIGDGATADRSRRRAMKIAIGSDEAAYELKEVLRTFIVDLGHEVKDFGTFDAAAAGRGLPSRAARCGARRGGGGRGGDGGD